ncbi:Extradiol ring-cleavage dioxygenase, class III enzyme, subunit B [Vararia minispora EC-137]|uniref:Extradiol ring-cleavage dioxygenase, class III enzyme, subunit B n=1 Tax=Vararia minispora EC-137 TaxID=1314806 RepID=A0ACB8QDA3_9AGAM|nr:Extradiol ring-cleavage dioxygenase, class III enzyme, subunit B [Vararia minispora EC-137]
MPASSSALPQSRVDWKAALASLPDTPQRIPSFFFAHGSPMLEMTPARAPHMAQVISYAGADGSLAQFLRDFGPALLEKYKPKAILVFSAHWDTPGERLVTDYGEENPLLMDYFGFDREFYELKFSSRGDGAIAARVVEAFKEAGLRARTTPATESRGRDGRGFNGPGLDHGVFIPFRLMFGHTFRSIPIISASMDSTLTATANWAIGAAVARLREEGVLVLSGGLTVHNLRSFADFTPDTASEPVKAFSEAVTQAIAISDPAKRKDALVALEKHPGYRLAHPHPDHFVPLYVAAGAGADGDVRVLSALYGCHAAAFGL